MPLNYHRTMPTRTDLEPKLQAIRDAVAGVPAGAYILVRDVAAECDLSPQGAGRQIAQVARDTSLLEETEVAGVWRRAEDPPKGAAAFAIPDDAKPAGGGRSGKR